MKKTGWIFCLTLIGLGLLIAPGAAAPPGGEAPVYHVLTVNAPITPAVYKFFSRALNEALEEGASGIIILLDTPGGLDLAMRDIVKDILNAPLPVFVYVHPAGARAASAGVMITIAAHVAAMAPGTNIGAAHPVAIGSGKMDETMSKKVENDAVAYVKSIAEERGRNIEWVEKAVRQSESITAEEALKLGVIDYVASDVRDLLRKAEGRDVPLPSGKITLKTNSAELREITMGFREKVLMALSDPNIAYLLLMIGLAGLYFEFSNPGAILPGVVGAIALILAFFALQTLPVNFAGVLLILFAVILFIAEIKIVSHGLLTVAGILSLALGSLFLFESPIPALRVSFQVLIPTVIIASVFFVAVVSLAVKAQMRKPRTGGEGMVGEEGKAVTDIHEEGRVFVRGEFWNAVSREPVEEGEAVLVTGIRGLVLEVEKTTKTKEETK